MNWKEVESDLLSQMSLNDVGFQNIDVKISKNVGVITMIDHR